MNTNPRSQEVSLNNDSDSYKTMICKLKIYKYEKNNRLTIIEWYKISRSYKQKQKIE